jgi:hypothetical protein
MMNEIWTLHHTMIDLESAGVTTLIFVLIIPTRSGCDPTNMRFRAPPGCSATRNFEILVLGNERCCWNKKDPV